MKGAAAKRQIDHELAIATGWWVNYIQREKRMGPLGKYLKMVRSGKKRATEMAAALASAFKSMQKRGLNVKVKKIPRGDR